MFYSYFFEVIFIFIIIFGLLGLLVIIKICGVFFIFFKFWLKVVIFNLVDVFGFKICFFNWIFKVELNICKLRIFRLDFFIFLIIIVCVFFLLFFSFFICNFLVERWMVGGFKCFCWLICEKFGNNMVEIGILFFFFILFFGKWDR